MRYQLIASCLVCGLIVIINRPARGAVSVQHPIIMPAVQLKLYTEGDPPRAGTIEYALAVKNISGHIITVPNAVTIGAPSTSRPYQPLNAVHLGINPYDIPPSIRIEAGSPLHRSWFPSHTSLQARIGINETVFFTGYIRCRATAAGSFNLRANATLGGKLVASSNDIQVKILTKNE